MVCHLVELQRVKSTRELLEVSLPSMAKVVKLTGAVLSQTELDTPCSTHYLEGLSDMIASSLLNILQWT